MSKLSSIPQAAKLINYQDDLSVADMLDAQGGYAVVATLAERNALPAKTRRIGMRVRVRSVGRDFWLADDGTWQATDEGWNILQLGEWDEVILDSTLRPVRGVKLDGSEWEARAGVMVRVTKPYIDDAGRPRFAQLKVDSLDAPGLIRNYPGLEDWDRVELDSSNRVASGKKLDGSKWKAVRGVLLRDPDVPVQEFPLLGEWEDVTLDGAKRFVSGRKLDGSKWKVSGGQIVQDGEAATASIARVYGYDRAFGSTFPLATAGVDYLILMNGQSWAQGGDNASTGNATVTTVPQHPGYAVMPAPGVRPDGGAFTSYADLFESYRSGSYETAHSGMADVIMTRLNARLGFKPRIIFASNCLGGQAYWDTRADPNKGLKRGSEVYAEGMRIVQACRDISAAQGRKLVVLAQLVVHGEQDFSNGTHKEEYQRALDQWNAHVNEDWRQITGQAEPIRTYVSQVQRGGAAIGNPSLQALAQLAAQERNPLIRCVGPVYQGPGAQPEDGGDGAHLKPLGYRMMGRLFGHFIVEDMFGPYEEPLRIIDKWWVSNTEIRLKYSKPVSIETTNALVNVLGITVGSTTFEGLGADRGVKFTDGGGSPPAVTGVAVSGGDTLVVTLSGAPAGKNQRLTIAGYRPGGTGSGCERGARSAIRSSVAFDTDALTGVTQYHWACHEQVVLPII